MSYLDLHKLQLGSEPYSVERVIDEEHQSSPECQLPAFTPLDLNLPSLDIEMPPLDCKFDIDTPLIPLPYFEGCVPAFGGSISLTSCDSSLAVEVIRPIAINQVDDCAYELDGELELCVNVPCPSGISGGGELTITKDGEGTGITLNNSLELSVTPCAVGFIGTLTITDNVVCPNGTEIDAAVDITPGAAVTFLGYTLTPTVDINVDTSSAADCQINLSISGTIGLTLGGSGPTTKTVVACTGLGGASEVTVYCPATP